MADWKKQEVGYYKAEGIGVLAMEDDGYVWFYPVEGGKRGPFNTFPSARNVAEGRVQKPSLPLLDTITRAGGPVLIRDVAESQQDATRLRQLIKSGWVERVPEASSYVRVTAAGRIVWAKAMAKGS